MATIKVNDLIKILKDVKGAFGNVNVYVSSDSEGNSYSTLNKEHSLGWDEEQKFIVIYPWEEGLDYDDLK